MEEPSTQVCWIDGWLPEAEESLILKMRSFRIVLEDMRVSEFAFLQAAQYAIHAHPEDAQGMETTFMNLAQRMLNLPKPHPQYQIGYADVRSLFNFLSLPSTDCELFMKDFLAVLGRQLLLSNDAQKLLKLWKLLPKILEEFRVRTVGNLIT